MPSSMFFSTPCPRNKGNKASIFWATPKHVKIIHSFVIGTTFHLGHSAVQAGTARLHHRRRRENAWPETGHDRHAKCKTRWLQVRKRTRYSRRISFQNCPFWCRASECGCYAAVRDWLWVQPVPRTLTSLYHGVELTDQFWSRKTCRWFDTSCHETRDRSAVQPRSGFRSCRWSQNLICTTSRSERCIDRLIGWWATPAAPPIVWLSIYAHGALESAHCTLAEFCHSGRPSSFIDILFSSLLPFFSPSFLPSYFGPLKR